MVLVSHEGKSSLGLTFAYLKLQLIFFQNYPVLTVHVNSSSDLGYRSQVKCGLLVKSVLFSWLLSLRGQWKDFRCRLGQVSWVLHSLFRGVSMSWGLQARAVQLQSGHFLPSSTLLFSTFIFLLAFFLSFIVLFESYCSYALLFRRTFVQVFPVCYTIQNGTFLIRYAKTTVRYGSSAFEQNLEVKLNLRLL